MCNVTFGWVIRENIEKFKSFKFARDLILRNTAQNLCGIIYISNNLYITVSSISVINVMKC